MLTIRVTYFLKAVFFILLLVSQPSWSQDLIRCPMDHSAMDHDHEHDHDEEPSISPLSRTLRSSATQDEEEIYIIPVVVHVIHHNQAGIIGGDNTNDNISVEQIESQIDALNRDFRRRNADTVDTPTYFKGVAVDTKIEFCLASIDPFGNTTEGITRTYTSKKNYHYSLDNAELKALVLWPPEHYLNIWVTTLVGPGEQTVLGYAQFPDGYRTGVNGLPVYKGRETDGVVIDYHFFGDNIGTGTYSKYYNRGRTTTHEVGHYLGLLHTFANRVANCTNADYCDDTPDQDLPTSETYDVCPSNLTSCGGFKMFQNYMDYTQDACMNLFTQDQKDRMRTILENSSSRNTLLTSPGCCRKEYAGTIVTYFEDFEQPEIIEDFWDYDTAYSPAYNWEVNESALNNSIQSTDQSSSQGDTAIFSSHLIHFISDEDVLNPTLRYDLSYSGNMNNNTELIEVQYDISCSDNWRTIRKIYPESDLNNQKQAIPFVPEDVEYTTFVDYINDHISNYYRAIRVRFVHISDGERQIHLDNITVNPNAINGRSFQIYPNPSKGFVTIDLLLNGFETLDLNIYDVRGNKVLTVSELLLSASYDVDLSVLNSGLYIVEAQIADDIIRQKIVIQK